MWIHVPPLKHTTPPLPPFLLTRLLPCAKPSCPKTRRFRLNRNYCQRLHFNFTLDTKIFNFECTAFYLNAASIIYKHSRQCRHVTGTPNPLHRECIKNNSCHVPVGVPLPVQMCSWFSTLYQFWWSRTIVVSPPEGRSANHGPPPSSEFHAQDW